MELLKKNAPYGASSGACFIDEYRLLGTVPSQGEQNKLELALWDTRDNHPSPVRFETEEPPAISTNFGRNRGSNHELPFHGDLSGGIVCVGNTEGDRGTPYRVLVIRVRDLIALSKGRGGKTIQWSEWGDRVTKLSSIPIGYSVLHSQVAYVHRGKETPVLYIHDFSCHLEWDNESNPKLISQTPTTPKKIELLHEGMERPSQYKFDITEDGVYATLVS